MLQKHPSKNPYGAWVCEVAFFYTDTIPTGFKRVLEFSRFSRRTRFGWETEPTGSGSAMVIFSKIDSYSAVGNCTYRAWGVQNWAKTRKTKSL